MALQVSSRVYPLYRTFRGIRNERIRRYIFGKDSKIDKSSIVTVDTMYHVY
jgi:hypothetical protein